MGSIILDSGIDTKGFEAGSKKLMGAIKSLGSGFGRDAKQVTMSVSNMAKGFLRATASMFGIVSVIGALRKAVNSYLAANKDLSSQLSSAWTALGNVLGPLIESIVGWITKAISYFLSFLKLLGLTNKTASQLSKTAAGAGGALQKSLMGFDELNKLSDSGGGGGGGKGLEDVEPPEWMERIVDFIKSKEFELAGRELAKKLNEMVEKAREVLPSLGKKFSEIITGALEFIYGAIDEFDWNNLGLAIHDFIVNIDFGKIIEDLGKLLWSALKGAIKFAYGLLGQDVGEEFPLIAKVDELREAVDHLIGVIQPKIEAFWEKAGPILGQLFYEAIDGLLTLLKDLADLLSGRLSFREFLSGMDEAESAIVEFLLIIGSLKAALGIAGIVKSIKGVAGVLGGTGVGSVVGASKTATTALSTLAKDGFAAVQLGVEAMAGSLGLSVGAFLGIGGGLAAVGAAASYAANETDNYYKELAGTAETTSEYITALGNLGTAVSNLGNEYQQLAEYGADVTETDNQLTFAKKNLIEYYDAYLKKCIETGEAAQSLSDILLNQGISADSLSNDIIRNADAMMESANATIASKEELGEFANAQQEAANAQEALAEANEKVADSAESISTSNESATKSTEKFEEATEETANGIAEAWGTAKKAVEESCEGIANSVDGLNLQLSEVISNIARNATVWGADIGKSIANGIASSQIYVARAANGLALTIASYLHFSEPDVGPLSNFHTFMPDMIDMMADGINSNKGKAMQAVESLAGGISDEIQNGDYSLNDVEVGFDTNMGNFADKIVAGFEDLIYRLEEIADRVTFETPAFAGGMVTPYSVDNMAVTRTSDEDTVSLLRDILSALGGNADRNNSNAGMPTFVIELDGRELAYQVTQYQRRDSKARGG